jgi:hypothetical protein
MDMDVDEDFVLVLKNLVALAWIGDCLVGVNFSG